MDRATLDRITNGTIGAAMKVHSALGPGLLESAYEACLAHVLERAGYRVRRQVDVPVLFEGLEVGLGYRMDLLVEDAVTRGADHLPPASKRSSSGAAHQLSFAETERRDQAVRE